MSLMFATVFIAVELLKFVIKTDVCSNNSIAPSNSAAFGAVKVDLSAKYIRILLVLKEYINTMQYMYMINNIELKYIFIYL